MDLDFKLSRNYNLIYGEIINVEEGATATRFEIKTFSGKTFKILQNNSVETGFPLKVGNKLGFIAHITESETYFYSGLLIDTIYQDLDGYFRSLSHRPFVYEGKSRETLSAEELLKIFPNSVPNVKPLEPVKKEEVSEVKTEPVKKVDAEKSPERQIASEEPKKESFPWWIAGSLIALILLFARKFIFLIPLIFIFSNLQARPFKFEEKVFAFEIGGIGNENANLESEKYFIPQNSGYTFTYGTVNYSYGASLMLLFNTKYFIFGGGADYGSSAQNNGQIVVPGTTRSTDTYYTFNKKIKFITYKAMAQVAIYAGEEFRMGVGGYFNQTLMKGSHDVVIQGTNYHGTQSFSEEFGASQISYEPFAFLEFHIGDTWALNLQGGYRYASPSSLKRSSEYTGFSGKVQNGTYLQTYDSKQHQINISGPFAFIGLRSYY